MQGKVEKKAVIIHESDCQAIQKFPEEERGKIARLIVRHGTSGGVVDKLSAEQRIALQPILDGIDTEQRRYQNVQYLQHLIDGVKKRAVSIPKTNENGKENSDYKVIENLVKVLQRMIVDCREHDRLHRNWIRRRRKVELPSCCLISPATICAIPLQPAIVRLRQI